MAGSKLNSSTPQSNCCSWQITAQHTPCAQATASAFIVLQHHQRFIRSKTGLNSTIKSQQDSSSPSGSWQTTYCTYSIHTSAADY
jgi:hypothetical protein